MAGHRDSNKRKLPFSTANAICREFIRAGDKIFDFAHKLENAGFSAFVPYVKFTEEFCENDKEIGVHRNCLVEFAKITLGTPWPIALTMTAAESELVYSSAPFEHLRRERDKLNGVPVERLDERYPLEGWRREVDPCRRKMFQAEASDRNAFERRRTSVLKEQRQIVEAEVYHHVTGLARTFNFDRRGRYAFFTAVMERDAGALGFVYDNAKSLSGLPVFSKQISNDWDLCWALEEPRSFILGPSEGRFVPYLQLRHRNLSGSVDKAESSEFLLIRYHHVVPGFGNAYWKFFSLNELETMIRAHLCVFNLMAPIVEEGLRKVLGSATELRPADDKP